MPRKTTAADPDRSAYGARLQAARQALGLTQAQVADRLGVSASYVSDLERGRRLEAWPSWLAMVTALGYDPAVVAPELVNGRPLVSRTRCPSPDVARPSKKTDRSSR